MSKSKLLGRKVRGVWFFEGEDGVERCKHGTALGDGCYGCVEAYYGGKAPGGIAKHDVKRPRRRSTGERAQE